jgi:signal transduction histidine kinase
MSDPDGRAGILIVDDKPEQLLALGAVLEDLGQRIVCAGSGREALRHLLTGEFAVILLDVNMPDMDGFETASLIRQRSSLQHVPIIFITAFGDEMHMARGYSLGAVDYIHTPVIPEVLRSKVSVFVELFQKTAQVRRQSESLHRRATQFEKLGRASIAINSAIAIEQMLQRVTDSARDMIDSHQCVALFLSETAAVSRRGAIRSAGSFSDHYAKWRDRDINLDALASTIIAQASSAVRLSAVELCEHPDWPAIRKLEIPQVHNGLLAAPLTDRGGRNLGIILLLDRTVGDFTSDDQSLLVQLAQIASIAIQNAIFAQEREAHRLKDEFLATLSHELRTPLNAIVGWTDLLRMEELPEQARHGLEVIERNVKAQSRLIEDLLDLSRITTGKMRLNLRKIALTPIVEAAVDAIRPAADARKISILSELAPEVQINGDPDRLQQVVWNLLSNAMKFTPARGRINVTLDRIDSQVQIRVVDTGQGISPEFLRFVFDRFRQADSTTTRTQGGLGIGLTIVRHIVELHGGTVSAYSAGLGKGAAFTVSLPVTMPLVAIQRTPVAESPGLPLPANAAGSLIDLANTRVLVVDDEADAREIACEILRRAHAEVFSAESVREAFDFLAKGMPHVLVSDLAMPGEDGYSFIRELREFPPDQGGQIPAIALTAYARETDRLRALSAGFQMHLTKPVEARQLVAAIAHLARGSCAADGEAEPPVRAVSGQVPENADAH